MSSATDETSTLIPSQFLDGLFPRVTIEGVKSEKITLCWVPA